MKLHLPTRLRAAVLACITAVAALSTTIGTGVVTVGSVTYVMAAAQAQAEDDIFNGKIYTFTPDDQAFLHSGTFNETTYEEGVFVVTQTTAAWSPACGSDDYNTLRFVAGSQTQTVAKVQFNDLKIGGVIVDADAVTETIGSDPGRGGATRIFRIGKADTTSCSIVNKDFLFDASNKIELSGEQTWTIASGKVLTLQATNGVTDNATVLNVKGGGTAKVQGNLTVAATAAITLTNSSALEITGSLSLDLSSITTSSPIIDGAGCLVSATGLTLSNYEALDSGDYALISTTSAAADDLAALFASSAKYTVSNKDGVVTLTVADSSSLVWNGGNGTWDETAENWLSGETAAHFAPNDSVTFATSGAQVTISGDKLTSGIQIDADTAWTGTATVNTQTLAGTGALSLDSGVTLSVAGSAAGVTINGSGTYAINTGTAALGVSLGEAWTGTVSLNRASNTVLSTTNLNLNTYGKAGSTVELTAVTGYFVGNTMTINPNLVLTNSPDGAQAGLSITNGSSNKTYTFAGSISGTGNFVYGFGSYGQTYIFEGDLSQWTGDFAQNNGPLTVTFNGAARQPGAHFKFNGGNATIAGDGLVTFKNMTMGGSAVTVNTDVKVDGTLTLGTGESSKGKALTIAEGKSLTATTMTNAWGTVLNLGAGSSLAVTGNASIAPGNGERIWAGEGVDSSTITFNRLSVSNSANIHFKNLSLHVGAGGITQDNRAGRLVLDNATLVADASFALSSANMTSGLIELQNDATVATGEHNVSINSKVTGEGTLTKTGAGKLTLSGTSDFSGGLTVSEGNVTATAASSLGAGAVNVSEGATLELTAGDVLADGQAVTNAGTVVLHDTLTLGTIANNGSLVIAANFAGLESAGIVNIDGGAAENGFRQGGTATIFTSPGAITGSLDASFQGETVTIASDGTVTLEDDFSTYHINSALLETETFSAMQTGAAAHDKTIAAIDFAVENQTLTVDAAGLATSMLQGEHAGTVTLAMGDGQTLTVDADTAAAISLADSTSATFAMSKDADIASLTLGNGTTVNVTGTGTLNIADTAQRSVNAKSTTYNIGENTVINDNSYIKLTGATLTFQGGGVYNLKGICSASESAQAGNVTIGAGTTLHITGTAVSVEGNTGSFMLSNWNTTSTYNVSGILISEAGISGRDGTGVINVLDGGTLQLNAGFVTDTGRQNHATIKVKDGGLLKVASTATAYNEQIAVELENGSTMESFAADGAPVIAQNLKLVGTAETPATAAVNVATETSLTLSGVISGANGGLNKTGEGSLVLSGANTYAGGTTVSAGALSVTSSAGLGTGAVTVAGGALTLAAEEAVSMGALTMTSGSIVLAGAEKLAINGAVTLSGGTLDFTNVTVAEAVGNTVLGTVTGAVSVSNVELAGLASSLTSQFDVSVTKDGNNLVLSVAGKSAPLYWNGGDGTWNSEATNTVWGSVGDDTSDGKAYTAGAQVTISGTEGGTITVSGAQTAASLTIAHSGYTITRTGNSDSLTITGALTVNEGVSAAMGFLPTLGDSGSIVVNSGATLDLTAAGSPNANMLGTLMNKGTGAGTIVVGDGGGMIISPEAGYSLSTNLKVNGGLWLNGPANSARTITVTEDGSLTLTGKVALNSGTELKVAGGSVTANEIALGHSEVQGYKGSLLMTSGSVTTGSFIFTRTDTANTITIEGGTLTVTGNADKNAFTVGADDKSVVSISNATLTNGETDMAFNHGSTLTNATIIATPENQAESQAATTITVGGEGMTTTLVGSLTTQGKVTITGTLATDELTGVTNSGELTVNAESVTLAGLNNTGSVTVAGDVELTAATTAGGELSAADVTLTGANTFSKLVATGTVTSDDTLTVGAESDMAAVSEGTKLTTTGDVSIGSEASLAALSNAGHTLTVDGALTLTAATAAGGSVVADSLTLTGANTFETLTLSGAVTLDTASYTTVGLTAAGVTGNNLALVVDQDTIVSAIGTSGTALTLANVTGLTGATINGETSFKEGSREYTVSVTDGLVQITASISNELVWDASTEGAVWGDGSSWEGGTQPTEESNVVFNGTGIADVTVSTGAVAQNVIVESETNFITTGTGEITTDGMEVNAGTLTIGEDVTVTVAETTNVVKDGNIVIVGTLETGALAAADKDVLLSGTLEIAKEGVVNKIKGIDGTCGHLIVGSDAAPLSLELVENKLTIAEDSVVDALTVKATGDLDAKGALTVNEDADVAEGGVMTVADDLTITGELENNGDITVGSESHTATFLAGKVTNDGTITVYNTMTATDDVINNADASLTVSGDLTATTEGKTVTNNGELSVGGDAQVAALTTGADSETEITGDATVTGALANGGTLTVNGALEADSLTTAAGATTEAKSGATISTSLTNQGTTTITGALTATDAAVTNEATGEGEKLSVSGALAADSLTTAAGATTEAKGGVTLGTSLTNHGTTTITGNLLSADASSSTPGTLTITNDATGTGEKLTVSGKVSGQSLTTKTGATTEISGGVKLVDDLVNDGTTTIKGALETADDVFNKGLLTVGSMKADKLETSGDVRVKGDVALKTLAVSSTGKLVVDGKLTTEAISGTAASVQADKLDLSGLTAAATIANLKADTITLKGFDMLTVTDSLSNEAGTGKAQVALTLDADTMSSLTVGDKRVVVAVDSTATGYGITLSNLAAVNAQLKTYGIKGAMVEGSDGALVMLIEDNSFISQLGSSENGKAGLEMADAASAAGVAPDGALAGILAHLDELRTDGSSAAQAQGDKIGAALSGASVAAMGLALSSDVDRQLRAIRNRTTTMGVNQAVVNEGMPYLNAWVNAEGDYRDIASDGSMPGYKLSSWGGTVGFDVDCTPSFTCGLAATAMYGDFDSKGDDQATGDLNTYYVTAFGRYAKHRWTHTFVATAGLADTTLSRTVDGVNVKGSSEGSMFGGMYEVGYVFALDKEATTCLQPIVNVSYTHATLNGYDESGSDIALKMGDVELNKLTIGAGARVQSVLGENIYNRSSLFEARALVKFDAGDRQGEVTNAFANYAGSASVKSVETGAFGAEFGVGLTVPVGAEGGNLFMDASAEIRSEYVNVNGTVGYRVNF